MAGFTQPIEEQLQIESGHVVPTSELTMASQIRRRFLHGDTLTTTQVADEIGGSNSMLGVVVAQMRSLGFDFDMASQNDRYNTKTYRLTDPSYRPDRAALDAHKARHRKGHASSKSHGPRKPPGDWVTAPEAAAILGHGDTDQVGKAYRRGALTKRKPRKKGAKGFYYDRAEVEALIASPVAIEAEPVEAEPEPDIPPAAMAVVRFLASVGGMIADARGLAATTLRDHFETLHYHRTTAGFGTVAAERAGLVERQTQGKRTYRIGLTDAGWAWLRAHPENEPEPEPTVRWGARVSVPLPIEPDTVAVASAPSTFPAGRELSSHHLPALPGLGADVTVYALVLNEDGSITMGLRNGAASWQVEMIGAAER